MKPLNSRKGKQQIPYILMTFMLEKSMINLLTMTSQLHSNYYMGNYFWLSTAIYHNDTSLH